MEECRFEFICLPDDVQMYSKNGLPILGAPGDSDSRTKKDTHPIRYPLTALSANLLIVINGREWSKEILRREEDTNCSIFSFSTQSSTAHITSKTTGRMENIVVVHVSMLSKQRLIVEQIRTCSNGRCTSGKMFFTL